MSNSVTIQDIYQLFQASQAEADRRAAELDRRFAELAEERKHRAAELDRRLAELAEDSKRRTEELAAELAEDRKRRAEEADRRAAALAEDSKRRTEELAAELAEDRKRRAEEADRRAAEAEKRLAKAEAIAANTNKAVSALTSRWGQFVENLVKPAAIRIFQERGITVTQTLRRLEMKRSGIAMEIDILAIDGDVAVAIEVKSNLSKDDVDYFLEKLARFKEAFPHYADVTLNGAVAGIEIDEGVDRYAYRQGLFVIQQSGEVVEIANDKNFRPKVW